MGLLNLSVSMCDAFRQEHEAATASRNEELDLLRTVRKMVRRRLEGIGSSSLPEMTLSRTKKSPPTRPLLSTTKVVTKLTPSRVTVWPSDLNFDPFHIFSFNQLESNF